MATYEETLRQWLAAAQLTSYRQLVQASGVGIAMVGRLKCGEAHYIPAIKLQALAVALRRDPLEVLQTFSPLSWGTPSLATEYQRLQQQHHAQAQQLTQQFQLETYRCLEPLLTQYPTAHYLATQAPQWSARHLTSLFLPLGQLLQRWHIQPLGTVGTAVPFDPQWHQASEGLTPGETVFVRFVGYRRGDTLLHRAKVSRTPPSIPVSIP